jgi:hypothetical protein
MQPNLRTTFDALERRRRDLLDRLAAYDEAQLAFRPAPDMWCLLEVAEHLALVEEILLAQANDDAFARRLRKTLKSRALMTVVWFVLGSGIRVKAPLKALVPKTVVPLDESARRLEAARRELAEWLERLEPGAERRLAFSHPIGGALSVIEGLDLVASHWDHHLSQVDRILASKDFPTKRRAAGA